MLGYNALVRQCLTLALIIAASLTAQTARAGDSAQDLAAAGRLARLNLSSQQVVSELTLLGRLGDKPELLLWGTGQFIPAHVFSLTNDAALEQESTGFIAGEKPHPYLHCQPVRGP